MLIVMKADATDAQIAHVCDVITELGFKAHAMPGATRTAIGVTGNQGAVDPTRFENLPGVADAIRVSKPYKLITLDIRPEKTVVRVGDTRQVFEARRIDCALVAGDPDGGAGGARHRVGFESQFGNDVTDVRNLRVGGVGFHYDQHDTKAFYKPRAYAERDGLLPALQRDRLHK